MPRSLRLLVPFGFLVAASAAIAEPLGNWPQFRGPDGQGHADSAPLNWSESDGVVWKVETPGRAWSSPVVANGRIWITTAMERVAKGKTREKLLAPMKGHPMYSQLTAMERVDLWALEFDLQTGQRLRELKLFEAPTPKPVHNLNSYASPTPILEENRLYCHFGTFGTACIDVDTGEKLWEREFAIDHGVGPGSSPALWEDLLIIPCDGMDQQYVVAVDKLTGEPIWNTPRPPIRQTNGDFRKAYCTPLIIEAAGRTQAVIPGAQWFISYDPASGEEIWRVDHGSGFSNVPRPVFDGQRLFLATGFMTPQLWAVRPDGQGDVSDSHVEWKQRKQIPSMPSPIVVDDLLVVMDDKGVVNCYDTATKQHHWVKRIPGDYCASPIEADGRIYLFSQEGRTTVIAASPDYKLLAKNDLDGRFMASPAVVDGDLILRTETHLYRIAK